MNPPPSTAFLRMHESALVPHDMALFLFPNAHSDTPATAVVQGADNLLDEADDGTPSVAFAPRFCPNAEIFFELQVDQSGPLEPLRLAR